MDAGDLYKHRIKKSRYTAALFASAKVDRKPDRPVCPALQK
jgi:hypothetical protein